MGGKKSTPALSSSTFSSPWREVPWERNQEELQYVRNYTPQHPEVTRLRVLLYGPVGAGKSSFINSVGYAIRGKMTQSAGVGNIQGSHSITKKYVTHNIKKAHGEYYNFVFNDVMGLEQNSGEGVSVEEIKLAMEGHVREGYKFNPISPLTPADPGYNRYPTKDDKVHILVCVVSGNVTETSAVQKMREIREAAIELGIPQIVVVTKFDEYCPETQENLRNIYKSNDVRKKMSDLSVAIGVPMNMMLPVKNYSEETNNNADIDALILNALKLIIDLGDDYLDNLGRRKHQTHEA